jgi:serine/threonine-protein kinase
MAAKWAGPQSGEAGAMQEDVENSAGVRPGDVLAGKYRIERVLGIGGMGVVVAATHLQLDEKVAIKFLLPAMLRNKEVVGRFAREARAAVKIKSEHVARVSDVGALENGAPFMVMEFLEGGDLAEWIERQGPLPIEQAVDFVLQACVGVASAHGIGIVHRDLKPANLFCLRGNDGQFVIKVLDFGISKITELPGSQLGMSATKTAAVMGSPLYMSPEQMQSAKDVGAQTDIWALGVVLYELLTGATPFVGESFAEIAIKVATASFAPVRSFRPDVPPSLEGVILKCLEKDKNRRYANVAELALALTDFGTKRSRPSIEKIVGIIQASGLSTSALALPPSPVVGRSPIPATKVSKSHETAMQPPASEYASLGTMAPSANTAHGIPRRPKALTVIGLASAISVAAATGLFAWAKHQPNTVAASPATSAPAISTAAVLPTSVVPEPPKPAEPLVAAPPTQPTPSVPPTRLAEPTDVAGAGAKPVRVEPRKTTTLGPKAPTPAVATTTNITPQAAPGAPQARPKPNCNPPWVIDSAGDRQYKPECL